MQDLSRKCRNVWDLRAYAPNGTDDPTYFLLTVGGRPVGGGMAGRLLDYLMSLASKRPFENLLQTMRFEIKAVQVATGVPFIDFATAGAGWVW